VSVGKLDGSRPFSFGGVGQSGHCPCVMLFGLEPLSPDPA
jgi:hypothetical protein